MTQRLAEIEKRMSADVVTEEKVDAHRRGARRSRSDARPAVAEASAAGRCRRRQARRRSRASTRRPSTPMSGAATRRRCGARGQGDVGRLGRRTAAIWCRPRPRPRSAGGWPRSRRSARIAGVRTGVGRGLKKPFATIGPADGLGRRDGGAAADRLAAARPSCSSRRSSSTPCRRRPQTLLDDAPSISTQWIAAEVETAFAEQEGGGLRRGDGVNKPRGFLDYADGGRGRLGLGKARLCRRPAWPARFPASDPSDVLIDSSMR